MGDHNLFIPTEAEKRRSISYILDAGMSHRAPFGQELRAVLEGVGVRGLLFGTGDCLALSLLIWVLCLLPALALTRSTSSLAPALFLFSPLLYAALFLLTGWKNLQAGIWEWTWTFQISARMVAALRMLCVARSRGTAFCSAVGFTSVCALPPEYTSRSASRYSKPCRPSLGMI